jgi:heme-degrading monooxygenase HmoA
MFARNVSLRLKATSSVQFAQLFVNEVVPLLRKQAGFRDVLTLGYEGEQQITAISLWDTKVQADAYNSSGYPAVLKILEPVLDGAPKVRIANVIISTLATERPIAVSA